LDFGLAHGFKNAVISGFKQSTQYLRQRLDGISINSTHALRIPKRILEKKHDVKTMDHLSSLESNHTNPFYHGSNLS
jgi:hypothetical protein